MNSVRVRFAPSPTGELHIGGARTALFNWLFARQNNGSFIMRIDDTDTARSRDDYLHALLDAMSWLGLDWDEGPEREGEYGSCFQSRRLDLYRQEIQRLLDEGKAYYCQCSPEELTAGREKAKKEGKAFIYPGTCRRLTPAGSESMGGKDRGGKDNDQGVVRFLSPATGETVVNDVIRGEVSFSNELIEDFVICKSNGMPTYNFASVVDDCFMKISHVIRAEEHLTNTPRQQMIAVALHYELPVYAHVPMILAPDRSKLSKRHGATSVQEFREMGILPEALLNYLALLGWSPPDEEEIITAAGMIKEFSLERVNKTAAIYDLKKITWLNGCYIRQTDPAKLARLAVPFLQKAGLIGADLPDKELNKVQAVTTALNDRIKTLNELGVMADYFFKDDYYSDPAGEKKVMGKDGVPEILDLIARKFSALNPFAADNIALALKSAAEELQISPGKINQPVRFALSGKTSGPDLSGMIEILGRDKVLSRLELKKK